MKSAKEKAKEITKKYVNKWWNENEIIQWEDMFQKAIQEAIEADRAELIEEQDICYCESVIEHFKEHLNSDTDFNNACQVCILVKQIEEKLLNEIGKIILAMPFLDAKTIDAIIKELRKKGEE